MKVPQTCPDVGQIGVDDALVETELASVRRNLEHIIDRSVHETCVNLGCAFGELLHHAFLYFRRLCDDVVVDRCRRREVELVCGLNIRRFLKQCH